MMHTLLGEQAFRAGMDEYFRRHDGQAVTCDDFVDAMQWAYQHSHAPGYQGDVDTWKTMVFTSLCLAQMGHAIAIRSNNRLTIEMNPFSNIFVLGAVIVTTILQLMLIYVPPLRSFFGTHALSLSELGICIGFSALMFVWIEGEKLFFRFRGQKNV
jgi:Ca2+-transporting ATPase